MSGGTEAIYRQVLSLFCEDAEERLPLLQILPDLVTLPAFVPQLHALKGQSASIGATELSARAAKLEAAGKVGDLAFIQENLYGFADQLTELVKNINGALEPDSR
jgi:HPt (histidine-containing phosphotransfer) domain-containing protein